MQNKDFEQSYNLFAKVILIYIIKEFKNLTGLNIAYEIEDISYINPALLGKEKFLYLIKNEIVTLKNYHENIRFIIKEKDFNTFKGIMEKKGYTNALEDFLKIISKSSIGMSVISGKKINSIFTINDLSSVYDIGHEEKFLNFNYRITVKEHPAFCLIQIVHEAVFEYFRNTFLDEIRLKLPYINFIKFISEPFINFCKDNLGQGYYFYPEKIDIKDYFKFGIYEIQDFISLEASDEKTKFIIYILYNSNFLNRIFSKNEINFKDKLIIENNNFFKNDLFFKSKNLKIQDITLPEMSTIDDTGILISYFYGTEPMHRQKLYLYIPFEFIDYFITKVLNKKIHGINLGNIKSCLDAVDAVIKKIKSENLPEFSYMPKRKLILDHKYDQDEKQVLSGKKEKKIKMPEDIFSADDKIIQVALTKLKPREITIILKSLSREVREKILSNMSKKTRSFYSEELSMGPKITKLEQKGYLSKFISVLNNTIEKY